MRLTPVQPFFSPRFHWLTRLCDPFMTPSLIYLTTFASNHHDSRVRKIAGADGEGSSD
jgi:hypothetical protein